MKYERAAQILRRRIRGETQKVIASDLGITQGRVQAIETRVRERLVDAPSRSSTALDVFYEDRLLDGISVESSLHSDGRIEHRFALTEMT